MKIKLFLIFTLVLTYIFVNTYSQITTETKGQIQNVDFTMEDDKLLIKYDIVNAGPKERFDIIVEIFTEKGEKIEASTFSGDLTNVTSGLSKIIFWHIKSDVVYLEDNIYVELSARHINPRVISYTGKGKAILLSTLAPGLGSLKITQKKYHIIKSVFAYSGIALSVYYNHKAYNSLEDYNNSYEINERNKFFEDSENQNNISKGFIIGSTFFWLLDYTTIILTQNKTKPENPKSISFKYLYAPINKSPQLLIRYYF